MSGHVAHGASINRFTPGVRNVEVADLSGAARDQAARVRERALAAAVLVRRCSGEGELAQLLAILGLDEVKL